VEKHGNEGREAKRKKKEGQHMFSQQFGFIFLNMETESEERGGCPSLICMQRLNHLRLERMLI
jgi:hypothetical protein